MSLQHSANTKKVKPGEGPIKVRFTALPDPEWSLDLQWAADGQQRSLCLDSATIDEDERFAGTTNGEQLKLWAEIKLRGDRVEDGEAVLAEKVHSEGGPQGAFTYHAGGAFCYHYKVRALSDNYASADQS